MRKFKRLNRQYYSAARKRRAGGLSSIFLTFLLFSIFGILIAYLPVNQHNPEKLSGHPYVIDGDTISLGKTHIRLKGIDAPETEQNCEKDGASYNCGIEARNTLRSKIGNASIRCETYGRDQYNWVLARCLLGETDLNRWLVQEGWAVSYGNYQHDEAGARRDKRGIWAGKFELPSQWRREHRDSEEVPSSDHGLTNDAIGDALAYIGEHIHALIKLILPRS